MSETSVLENYLELVTYGFTNPMPDSDDGPWKITAKDVIDGEIKFSTARKTTREAFDTKLTNKSRPKIGDVLLTKDGTLGRLAIVQQEDICVNQSVAVLRPNKKILPEYLLYLLSTPKYQRRMIGDADGTVIKHIYITRVGKMAVNIPSIAGQKEILKHLLALDKKIKLNHQVNQTLEQIAQAIFKSWFIDFEPVKAKIAARQNGQDPERAAMCAINGKSDTELDQLGKKQFQQLAATAALFPDELVDSELGEIPKEWGFRKLGEICKVLNGRAYKNTEFKEEGTPIVRIQNLSGGGNTVYSDLSLPDNKLIDKEDFIYAWSATFGPYIWRGQRSIYHYHIWKMEVDEKVISRYFLYLSIFRKTEQMKSAGTGSIFTHLTKSIMEGQDILIGSPEINRFFGSLAESYFKKITKLEEENQILTSIRDALLPKLLSGEISLNNTTPLAEAVA